LPKIHLRNRYRRQTDGTHNAESYSYPVTEETSVQTEPVAEREVKRAETEPVKDRPVKIAEIGGKKCRPVEKIVIMEYTVFDKREAWLRDRLGVTVI
jgi:hypothetical protein